MSRPSSSLIANELRGLGLLIPASMLGVLTRLSLSSLTNYPSPLLPPVIYSQAIGSLVIGLANGLKPSLEFILTDLTLAIATGYCGSLTTFSTLMLDLWKSYTYINTPNYASRNAKGATFDFLSYTLSTTCIAVASAQFGLALGKRIQERIKLPKESYQHKSKISLGAAITLGVVSYIITLALALTESTHRLRTWTYALLFGPAGAYLRHKLAGYFNKPGVYIPYGTLMSNVLGTVFTCLGFGLFHLNGASQSSQVRCNVLQALQDGLGGSLSTVSSMAMELNAMGVSRRGFVYSAISVLVSQAVCIVIAGSMKWSSQGFGDSCAI